jgi:hypothetical protein
MASISVKQIFTKATILGAGIDRLSLSESQVFCLLQISIHDFKSSFIDGTSLKLSNHSKEIL